jgi:hypothetical protein
MSAFDGQADLLATLIASCAEFQSVVGASGATAVTQAKDKIAIHEALDKDTPLAPRITYPRAIIADGGVIERQMVGTAIPLSGTGSLYLGFEFEAPADKTTTKSQRAWFLSKVSTIMREAEVLVTSRATPAGYSTSHLQIRSYKRTAGPMYVQPSERAQPTHTDNRLRVLWVIEFEVIY